MTYRQKLLSKALLIAEEDHVYRHASRKAKQVCALQRYRLEEAKRFVQWVRDYYPDWTHRELEAEISSNKTKSGQLIHAEFDRRLDEDGSPRAWKASVRRRLRKL